MADSGIGGRLRDRWPIDCRFRNQWQVRRLMAGSEITMDAVSSAERVDQPGGSGGSKEEEGATRWANFRISWQYRAPAATRLLLSSAAVHTTVQITAHTLLMSHAVTRTAHPSALLRASSSPQLPVSRVRKLRANRCT